MSWIIENIAELSFEEHAASVGEVASRLFCILIRVEACLALFDGGQRRSSPHMRLLSSGRMHFEMLDAPRKSEACDARAKSGVV